MPPREPPVADPLISVHLWTGPESALAARLGMSRIELSRALKTVGRSHRGRLTVEVNSPVAMTTLRRVLRAPPVD